VSAIYEYLFRLEQNLNLDVDLDWVIDRLTEHQPGQIDRDKFQLIFQKYLDEKDGREAFLVNFLSEKHKTFGVVQASLHSFLLELEDFMTDLEDMADVQNQTSTSQIDVYTRPGDFSVEVNLPNQTQLASPIDLKNQFTKKLITRYVRLVQDLAGGQNPALVHAIASKIALDRGLILQENYDQHNNQERVK
jgi:hypothetical protein